MNDFIRRIQWSNSADPKITVYSENGTLAIIRGTAVEAFTNVLMAAFAKAEEARVAEEVKS